MEYIVPSSKHHTVVPYWSSRKDPTGSRYGSRYSYKSQVLVLYLARDVEAIVNSACQEEGCVSIVHVLSMMIRHIRTLGGVSRGRTLTTSSSVEDKGAVVGRDSRRRTRRDLRMEEGLQLLQAHLDSIAPQRPKIVSSEPKEKVDETRGELWRKEERKILFDEAGFLARSLFRGNYS